MTTDWHAATGTLIRFAEDPGGLDPATAASVEAHLVACSSCRRSLADVSDPATLQASWQPIADRIDQPRPHTVERLLRRGGVGEETARLVSATPALSVAWLAAMTLVAAAAVWASRLAGADGPYLLIAPIAPLAAVAITFASVTDPAGEAGIPTPMNGVDLFLRRAVAVLVPAFLVLGAFGLGLPSFAGAVAWVLPALALTLASLALGTWWRLELTATGLALAWLVAVTAIRRLQGQAVAFADSMVFSASGQIAFLVLGIVAGLVLAVRHDRLVALEVNR
jgi:hypothetical protein